MRPEGAPDADHAFDDVAGLHCVTGVRTEIKIAERV
jgi:hypothetical protein